MKNFKVYQYISIIGICIGTCGFILNQDLTKLAFPIILIGLLGQIVYSDLKDRIKILIVGVVSAALLITVIFLIRL